MEILKRSVKGSPYIGIFSLVTEDYGIFPMNVERKEIKGLEELLGVRIVKANIANSSLIGAFCLGMGSKLETSYPARRHEQTNLKCLIFSHKKVRPQLLLILSCRNRP